ncbi:magnesium transporter [Candidatus Woesearchaeota archaeon]|nr:magnesium transporter [Candidatus Woesearchaeota archaeon]
MQRADIDKIRDLLGEDTERNKLRKHISKYDIPMLAIIIDQLDEAQKLKFYLLLPTKISSDVLLEVSQHSRKYILKSLKDKYIVSLIEKAESDDSADILGEVPEQKAKRIMEHLPRKKKDALEPLIRYGEDTAGGLMQSELIALKSGITVKEALDTAKKKVKYIEAANYIYVVDSQDRLKGVVTIRDLISFNQRKKLSQIMNRDLVKLRPQMDKEKVAEIFKNEDILALPVVDSRNKLLGRVTIDDVLDVMEEEATEDMYKIAGVHPDENIFDPFTKSVKRRLPWLMLNLGTAFLAALVVSSFTDTLQAVVILAAFMPIIAGLGGNSGTQTLTLIVRGFALNQLSTDNYRKILFKEISIGIVNGMILGAIMGIVAYLWQGNAVLGFVIFTAMTISLTLAGFIATSVPVLLKVLKIDPAVASSVFITASIDIVGFFSFLGIASLLISWLV